MDKLFSILISFLIFLTLACENDTIHEKSACDGVVTINNELYKNASTANFEIVKAEIIDNCLKLKFNSSGCDGNSWQMGLIDSGNIQESFPPRRSIRFTIQNNEVCDAWLTKEYSFDLSKIQVEGNKILLKLSNWEELILYEY